MVDIRPIIASFLLIMQTNNAILARIEFMVVLNSILLLILFIFDTYRRRSRTQLVKYILLVVDAASHSMVLHTIGLMQSAPIRNNLFEVWAILLVALRFSTNYITVYGLQEQGRVQWNMEFGAAMTSFTWAGKLNGTRNSDFNSPLWLLWVLQPLRVGYMFLAYIWARKSYWQGRSSVLLADYMETENRTKDPAASNSYYDLKNKSQYRPRGTKSHADCEVGPSNNSKESDQRDKPPQTARAAEPKTTHNKLTDAQKFKSRTMQPDREIEEVREIEEASEETDYKEPSNCNRNTKPEQNIGEADLRTNLEEPISCSDDYDPLSMKGYRYLIKGETSQEVEAKNLEDKLQLRVTHEEKLITLDKIWQCNGKLLGEWGDKDGQLKDLCLAFALYRLLRCRFDDYSLPETSIPKTRRLLVEGILCPQNGESAKEENEVPEDLQVDNSVGLEGSEAQQRGIKVGNSTGNQSTRRPHRESKQPDRAAVAQQEGEENQDEHVQCQNGSTVEHNRDANETTMGAQERQGSVKHQDRTVVEQLDVSKAENDENEIKDEVAKRVFEITGAELSFLNDYMYSRFPVIFWRGGGLVFSIVLYIAVVATTVWIGVSIVHVYTPPEGDFTHVVHGHNVDVFITWGILLFILSKETWEILIYLSSDWTKVVLISMYVERVCMRNCVTENLIWLLCKFSMVGRWHGKIDQYNFLEAYDYRPPICNLAYYLSLGSVPKATDGVQSKSHMILPTETKKAIVKSICSLKEELKAGSLRGGLTFILKRNNLGEEISELCESHELPTCSHIILIWHVATSLCEIELCRHYNMHLAESELPSVWSHLNCCSSQPFLIKQEKLDKALSNNFTVANSLSRYCAHLLIKQPNLLPDHIFIPEEVFQHAVREARDILEGCDTLQTIYKRLMKEGGKEVKSKNEKTIIRLGARLGKLLIETLDDEAARWKAIADVWADLLVYMAPNSDVEAHKECLATGGEFITHVWMLLYHVGVLENSLADQEEEDNDIEKNFE
ncbi:hypothetical protein LUZ61_008925 [Rhynchospora tenuis]|uniref:DUF4220 domain-containing protein n=1 Tax=Rhynchospora tenuis TaxID=198213 RepID=A0AAD6EY32_9POAL|nr:hypothetical protein LUZ61_008925 [Rhynchospora tenuis]